MAKKEKDIKPDNNKKSKKEEKNKRHFFKDFKAELKKVVWLTPKQLLNSTVAVIVIVLVVGVIVFALDFGFELLNKYGIKHVQTQLQQSYFETNNEVETNTTSENESNNVSDNTSNENANVGENETAE